MAKLRIREHVNPLSRKYEQPINPPNWQEVYANIYQPLHLDLGCARGVFLLKMAQMQPDKNFLGIEIRKPLVEEANSMAQDLGLTNLYYLFANVNTSLSKVFASLPTGILQTVTIQFPDPWFKNKHSKRRMLQPDIVHTLAHYLPSGAIVFLQSDVEKVATEMSKHFTANAHFQKQHQSMWLDENPFPIATEREMTTMANDKPVYRSLFVSIDNFPISSS